MSAAVAFVGPSLPAIAPGQYGGLALHPAARRGDVTAAWREGGARLILLIDGLIVYDYPPSPMEVLKAIEAGVELWGAASLGALRAVELEAFGMLGAGWVFARYREGVIDSDDEVVTPLDAAGRPTTVPLVNVRFALERLVAADRVVAAAARRILLDLRELHFTVRTPQRIQAVGRAAGLGAREARALTAPAFDVKAHDAAAALAAADRRAWGLESG